MSSATSVRRAARGQDASWTASGVPAKTPSTWAVVPSTASTVKNRFPMPRSIARPTASNCRRMWLRSTLTGTKSPRSIVAGLWCPRIDRQVVMPVAAIL